MKSYKFIAIIVFIIVSVSCSEKNNNEIIQVRGFDEQCLFNGDSIEVESFKIINLELTEMSLIDNIRRVEYIDSLIFIQTDNHLFSFDSDGKFLSKYGTRGYGPGEYLAIYSFAIEKEKRLVLLLDESSGKIITFDYRGNFVSEKKYDRQILSFWSKSGIFVDDDIILFTNYLFDTKNTLYSLFNIKNEHIEELYKFPVKTDNTAENVGFSTVSQFRDTIRLVAPFDNNVYTLNDGRLSPYLMIQTKQPGISKKELQSINDYSIQKFAEYISRDYFTGFTGVFETLNYIMLEKDYGRKYFLINKKTMHGRLFNYNLSGTHDKLPLIRIVSSNSDYFIGVLDQMGLFAMENNILGESEDKNLQKPQDYIRNFDANSNPCLLFYKLKYPKYVIDY